MPRTTSAPCSASTWTARPPSNRTSSPVTVVPDVNSGLVEVTTPSTRSGSGVVNTSSVGMLGWCSIPSAVSNLAASQRLDGSSPTLRSVPGPSNCSAVELELVQRRADALELSQAALPGRHRVGLVEPA